MPLSPLRRRGMNEVGLDMYLRRHTSVQHYWLAMMGDGVKPKVELTDIPFVDVEKIVAIVEEVCYWRKVNCVHQWFVDNVQDGEDDCGSYNVNVEELVELAKLCMAVHGHYLGNKNNHGAPKKKAQKFAEEKLPVQHGFFFGSNEYDKQYFLDIEKTIDMLNPLILELLNVDNKMHQWLKYSSSW